MSVSEANFFTGLTDAEQGALRARLRPRRFATGATILQQGQLSGVLHIIERGAVNVTANDGLGNTTELARLGPGQLVGELSILTGQPHSATVTAHGPTETLVLARDDFLALLADSPHLARNVLRALSERLVRTTRRQAATERGTVVAIESPFDHMAGVALALNLAVSLARQGRAPTLLILDDATLAGPLAPLADIALPALETVAVDPAAVAAHRAAPMGHPALHGVRLSTFHSPAVGAAALTTLGEVYRHIVLGPGSATQPPPAGGARAFVLAPVGRLSEAATARAIAGLGGGGWSTGLVATDLARPPSMGELAALGRGTAAPVLTGLPVALRALATSDLLPPAVRRDRGGLTAAGIDRLARDVAGLKVGLALGAGSARGFAHIGVLRVLEREGIPVDAIAGTSVGAFVAAFWACGLPPDAIADALARAARRPFALTLPRAALFSNHRIGASVRRTTGGRAIEDLPVPFAAVAVDLHTREPVVLHHGPLWEACLASGTIPGVYPPLLREGRALVDGVVRMPVPTGVVADLGGNVVIGVRLSPKRDAATAATSPPVGPNLVDTVFTILEVMQEAIESHGSERANLIIHPEVTKVTLREFAVGRALIEAGEAAAEEALPALRRLLPWLDTSVR